MGAGLGNVSKGGFGEKVRLGNTFKMLILKVAEADASLRDYLTVAAMLAGLNTEANFTNYARKTVVPTRTVDLVNDRVDVSLTNVQWGSPAGGAINNTTARVVLYHDVDGTDANAIIVFFDDFVVTTDGVTDIAYQPAAPFMRAS